MKELYIKPGTIVHCTTYSEALELTQMSSLTRKFVMEYWDVYREKTGFRYDERGVWTFGNVEFEDGNNVIEFNHLVKQNRFMIEKTHICCELMTGEVFNFDEMCNEIDAEAGGILIRFMAVNNETGRGINLAVIPVANIKKIVYMYTQEHINDILGEEG